jgi:cell division protein FtsI/penicillin-binding protein 2
MRGTFNRRLALITGVMIVLGVALLARLAWYQFQLDVAAYWRTDSRYVKVEDEAPMRGLILDRNGEMLAGNTTEYRVGISPVYITRKEEVARQLAQILGLDEAFVYAAVTSTREWVPLTRNLISAEVARQVEELNLLGVRLDPEPKRIYPQGSLASHVVGFVGWEGTERRGYVGVEGDYDDDLAGQKLITEESNIPFEANANTAPPPGRDIMLTIDRRLQYIAETELQDAVSRYGAIKGTIIIMDPRNGEILAMASLPNFDPNTYDSADPKALKNPAISDVYEPGSVFKIVTAALALQSGNIDPDTWTYTDFRVFRIGGADIYNWDRAGHGMQTFEDILVHSWNVGTSTLSVEVLGRKAFYAGLKDFGVGTATGIDLEGEAPGTLKEPGISLFWSESDLATNSFGQGLTTTPLQMLAFTNTIANGGQMMQPHIRLATIDGNRVIKADPVAVRSPVSPQVANRIRDIMVKVVAVGEGRDARVPGYSVAGKTGTAQRPCAECERGYDPYYNNVSFVGFLPADEPRVSIIIQMERIPKFASETAAPAFAQLARRVVVVMNIPTDAERRDLQAQGGQTDQIPFR